MDEHRDVEITSREHLSHMRQVYANVISVGVVLWIIRTNLDRNRRLSAARNGALFSRVRIPSQRHPVSSSPRVLGRLRV